MLTEPVTCSSCGAVSVNGGTIHCSRCFTELENSLKASIARVAKLEDQLAQGKVMYDAEVTRVAELEDELERKGKMIAAQQNLRADLQSKADRYGEALEYIVKCCATDDTPAYCWAVDALNP